ncbi:myosin-crossreactive antigen [Polychytrium aggregatum]|uniref:myosin-crossreactive antigen n=1 Tax=Polychytrium aggregatum TaxID=110093 RepID=UPI0022FECE25|nr:myosin-crossreactive antigen [Polychytrium aggregatum]KAI9199513.1 myosin-crossreactive antigen [Polychytrium aggregatum]
MIGTLLPIAVRRRPSILTPVDSLLPTRAQFNIIRNLTKTEPVEHPSAESQVYLVGGGIAALSAAFYLIQDAGMDGANIHVLENLKVPGGSMDAHGTAEKGYLMRGGRMFDREAYTCLYDILANIPSLRTPGKSCKEDIFEFSAQFKTCSKARVVAEGAKIMDVHTLGLNIKDRAAFTELILLPEAMIDGRKINDYFTEEFFTSNFWYCFCTTFAFQPWHSLLEFRRYALRFMHEVPQLDTLAGVWRTPYNQYDSIIHPLQKWLSEKGVQFEYDTIVTSVDFEILENQRYIYAIHGTRKGVRFDTEIKRTDLCLVTLGSMTAGSSIGSMSTPPKIDNEAAKNDPCWVLWRDIAKRQPDFGRPEVFYDHINDSKFLSFSVTFHDSTFMDRLVEWTKNEPGTGALVTFKDSNWFMSTVFPHQPHFANQPKNVNVMWGYSLFPDRVGNFVKKPMTECSGEEILIELLNHYQFTDILEPVLKSANCIPSMLPYTMSQFNQRRITDRPKVIPQNAINFGFMSQFVESIPEDTVFTVEYSVRCAQIAVYGLLKLDKPLTPIYKGWLDPKVLVKSSLAINS